MATHIFIVAHFLLIVTFANGQFVTLTSPLGTGQNFYCDQDRVSCNGSGTVILWTAPPYIPDNAPEGFRSNDMQQVPDSFGDVEITLTNVEPGTLPLFTSELTLLNVSEINVTCQTDVPGSLQGLSLIRSTTPTTAVRDLQLFYINNPSFRTNWTAPTGNFDIMHYIVKAFRNDTVVYLVNSTNTYVDVQLSRPLSSFERLFVTVDFMTRCGEVGLLSKSDAILYIDETENDVVIIIIAIVLGVICLALLALLVVLLMWILCKHYEKRTVPSKTDHDDKHIELNVSTLEVITRGAHGRPRV